MRSMKSENIALVGPFEKNVLKVIEEYKPSGFELFTIKSEDEISKIKEADYIIVRVIKITNSIIKMATKVRLIQRWGVGYDKVDIESAGQHGVPVAIAAGINASPVSELVILLILSLYRHLPLIHNKLKDGIWMRTEMRGTSYMIEGKLAGIIGLGNIGKQVSRKLQSFGAKVQYFDINRLSSESESRLNVNYSEFETLLRTSDIVCIHTSLNKQTKGMINSKTLSLMKSSSILINTSRGEIINEKDLVPSLKNKKLRGAGLDVFEKEPIEPDNPLLKLENVILTPHIGGAVFDNVKKTAQHCFANILKVSRGESLPEDDLVNKKFLRRK